MVVAVGEAVRVIEILLPRSSLSRRFSLAGIAATTTPLVATEGSVCIYLVAVAVATMWAVIVLHSWVECFRDVPSSQPDAGGSCCDISTTWTSVLPGPDDGSGRVSCGF